MKYITLIVIVILVTILSACTSTNIKVPESIKYADVDTELNHIFDKYEIDTDRLFIADISTISSYIWIDSLQDKVSRVTLEAISVSENRDSAKVLSLRLRNGKGTISKRRDYDLTSDGKHYKTRVSVKEYLSFISEFKDTSLLDQYYNEEVDFFDIATDGLCRKIIDEDFVFKYDCYLYSDGEIQAVEDTDTVPRDKYYLPVFLSTGKIAEVEGSRRYYSDIVAVVLLER